MKISFLEVLNYEFNFLQVYKTTYCFIFENQEGGTVKQEAEGLQREKEQHMEIIWVSTFMTFTFLPYQVVHFGYSMQCKSSSLFLYIRFRRHLWHDFDKCYQFLFPFLFSNFWTFTINIEILLVLTQFSLPVPLLYLEVCFQSQFPFPSLLQKKRVDAQITEGS